MNKLLEAMKTQATTENGGNTYSTTKNAIDDLFALGGAYRNRTDEECVELFLKAYEEDSSLALKCLFYLRDVCGGKLVA